MNQNAALLRALKGAPVSIVLALLLHPDRALGAGTLSHLTGYSPNSITHGLATLQELGLAQNHSRYGGWTLTSHCRQLILPAGPKAQNLRLESQTLGLPAVSSSSRKDPDPDLDLTPTDYTPAESQNLRLDLLQALLDAGIYHDLAHRLALDPWVTLERLQAWQDDIERQRRKAPGRIQSPTGLLARNLQHHREPPPRRPAWAAYEREKW